MKYDRQICCDLVSAKKAVVAYICKYCYKGKDMARARVLYSGNEIEAYKSIRYISSSEEMWRIFGFSMQHRSPTVILLFVHLQGKQVVVHEEDDDRQQRQKRANAAVSPLMQYMRRPGGAISANLTSLEYFEQFIVQLKQRRKRVNPNEQREEESRQTTAVTVTEVMTRLRRSPCVCRINFMSPDVEDIWYLRLLLHQVPASSWIGLRTVNGIPHDSYEGAARALGIVADSQEFQITFREAITFSTPRELRSSLVTLIIAGAPACLLWNEHKNDLMSDLPNQMSQSAALDSALRQIDGVLSKHGKSTESVGLPTIEHPDTEYHRLLSAFNQTEMNEQAAVLVPQLNCEQRQVFDAVSLAISTGEGGAFMIDAPAGSCKTFTMCALSADLRAKDRLVLCSASTGIAALLLPGGLTAHSTLKISFGENLVQGSSCHVRSESERAEVLRRADLIIWDEIPMSNKFAPEALDLTLRDLRRCDDKPFEGATLLFSGDFRQVGPVVLFGTPADVVEASLISSHLWKHVKRFRFVQSMRDRLDKAYSNAVRAVGEGIISPLTLPDTSTGTTSTDTCTLRGVTQFQHLFDFVYPDIMTAEPTEFANRGILSPTNVRTHERNEYLLNLLPADREILSSSNKLIKSNPTDIAEVTSPEFLQSVDVTGVPPHYLSLKVGCVVMFVRNVNFACGIVNGRQGVVSAISHRIVDVKMIAEGSPLVKIPRITFEVKVGRQG
ncbi:unnamed protein product [Scytosiphon promiscuus]